MPSRLNEHEFRSFDRSPNADFHYRLIGFLREQLPDETAEMSDEGLLGRVLESERRAARYGVESEAGITQWMCLTFLAGHAFDEIPEVASYLREPEPAPDEKMDELVDNIESELQQQG